MKIKNCVISLLWVCIGLLLISINIALYVRIAVLTSAHVYESIIMVPTKDLVE